MTVATSTNKALHWQLDVMLLNRNGAVSWQTKVPYERYSTHFQRAPSTCWHFGEAGIEILNASRYPRTAEKEQRPTDRQTDRQRAFRSADYYNDHNHHHVLLNGEGKQFKGGHAPSTESTILRLTGSETRRRTWSIQSQSGQPAALATRPS